MTTQPPQELPELPDADAFSLTRSIYTADQMREYGRACIAASQAGRAPVALVDCRNGDMKAHWTLPRQDLEHGTQLFAGPPLEVREAMSEEQKS